MRLYSFSAEETVVIEGKALKLTTREDVEQYIKEIQSKPKLKMFVTSGNSYGAEAAVALAEALQVQGNLIVLYILFHYDYLLQKIFSVSISVIVSLEG